VAAPIQLGGEITQAPPRAGSGLLHRAETLLLAGTAWPKIELILYDIYSTIRYLDRSLWSDHARARRRILMRFLVSYKVSSIAFTCD
jgi:hypothetical protein